MQCECSAYVISGCHAESTLAVAVVSVNVLGAAFKALPDNRHLVLAHGCKNMTMSIMRRQ